MVYHPQQTASGFQTKFYQKIRDSQFLQITEHDGENRLGKSRSDFLRTNPGPPSSDIILHNMKELPMMQSDAWLHDLPLKKTRSGVRIDLRFYVYPDGHGNVVAKDKNQPVNDTDEAVALLLEVWRRAQERSGQRESITIDEV